MSTSNSLPQSRSLSVGSGGGRPLPVLPPTTATGPAENGVSAQPLDVDSDSDARKHCPSSNPRTQFTSQTPVVEKEAIHSLKTKMSFSDNSAPSSTASTPVKSTRPAFPPYGLTRGSMTDPSRLQPTRRPKVAESSGSPLTHLAKAELNGDGDGLSDEGSEGEVNSSVTISALLSKLESVRNFLREAETLHKRFQSQKSEPGVPEQLAKLERLIAELKEQESSHLRLLLAVMAASDLKVGGHLDKKDLELSEDEESDKEESDSYSEGEDPANQTVVKVSTDDSFSLRAQIAKRHQENIEKEEELKVLSQQQELLKKLLTQQRQIQELEMRQAALLKMKEQAQAQIAEAETKVSHESAELKQLTEGALDSKQEEEKEKDVVSGQAAVSAQPGEEHRKSATPTFPPSDARVRDRDGELEERVEQLMQDDKTTESSSLNQDRLLLMKVAELRARKERVEQLIGLLGSMRMEDKQEAAATVALTKGTAETQEPLPGASGRREEPPLVASQPEGGDVIGVSAEATTGHSGASELVRDDEVVAMAELQERIRKAEEARKKLRELQEMISHLHDYSPDNTEPEDDASPPEQLRWRLSNRREGRGRDQVGVALSDSDDSDDEAEEETENVTLNTTLTEDFDPAEQSMVKQYESRLAAKKQEVIELQNQRDDLRRTHDRLMLLQSQLLVPGGGSDKAKPTSGKEQSRRNKDEEKALDTTTATWGGSTLPSEIEEGEKSPGSGSSVSLPSAILANMTQDSILPNASALAGSASVEQRNVSQGKPAFKVTRHTPRNVPSQRPFRMRTISSPADQSQTKRRKLDTQNVSLSWQPEPQEAPRPTNPDPYATTYFASPQQQPTQLDMSHMTTDSSHYYSSLLYSQLAMTSNMCSELLHSQNNLIGAVCSHLEMIGHQAGLQQHHSTLFHYQKELEQYYNDLYQRYSQMSQQHQGSGGFQSAGAQTEPEDPVGSLSGQQFNGTQGSTGRGSPTNEMPGSSSAQLHEASPRMPPPPPSLSTQPHSFHFRHYSGQQASDAGFGTTAEAATNATGDNSGMSAPPAPPIPPPTFNPYQMPFHSPYHMHPYYCGPSPMSRSYGSALPYGLGFGPAPPSFFNSFSPSPQFAPLRPNPLPGYPYRSPMSHPRHHNWSHHSSGPTMFGSPGQAAQFVPSVPPPHGAPPYPFMNHLPPFAHPPFSGHHVQPSFLPGPPPLLGTSFANRSDFGNLRPSTLLPPQSNLQDDHLGFHSPSGITAASLQVQPPSSPPSAPSVNLQTTSSNQNNCNATSTAVPKLGTSESSATGLTSSFLNPTSLGGLLQYPSLPPSGGISTASPLTQATFLASASNTGSIPGMFQQPSSATKVSEATRFYNFGGLKSDITTGASGSASGKRDEEEEVEGGHQPEESLSSLPVSIPEELSHLQLDALESELLLSSRQKPGEEDALASEGPPGSGCSVFDSLRETIYSEVATFIANNEMRPHFLVELFRELQMLTSDYLRQRALYNLQDLVTRYLTEEGVAEEAKAGISTNMFQGWAAGSVSEHTPSESGMTTEEEPGDLPKPPLVKTNSQKYDYVEPVHSASSLSTPPHSSSFSDEPFASESLGATAIRLDKEMAKMKRKMVSSEEGASPFGLRPPVISPGPLNTKDEDLIADVNTEELDELIKMIMIEVIPIFKENLESTCTPDVLAQIKKVIINFIVEQEEMNEKQELSEAFTKQLEGAINATAEKYSDKPLKDCGEDFLVEISEVLFNELTFFRLLQDFKGHPPLSADLGSTNSLSTTENEDYERDKPQLSSEAAMVSDGSSQPWDPTLLQALCLVATNTNLAEEEEALGKSRDDDLAVSWDNKMQDHDRSSLSADEDGIAKVVELSLSESQPLNSAGSGEEDVEEAETTAAALDSVQPPPHPSGDDVDLREATPTPTGASQPEQEPQPLKEGVKERGGETPPTPLATEPEPSSDPSETAAQEEGGKSCAGDGEKDGDPRTFQEEDGEEGEEIEQATGIARKVASSPPLPVSKDQTLVLTGLNEEELASQMKKEQQRTEGVAGILASIDEKGKIELTGDGNELATPTQSYVET